MLSDEQLMSAYVAGDIRAFEELFQRYTPILLRVLSRRTATDDEARDLVQQTFLQVHRARLDFQAGAPFRPWVFTIAFNLHRQVARSRGRRPEVPLEPETRELAEPDRPAERAEASQAVHAALAQLPATYREVLELRWLDGLSYEEAAVVTGASAGALKLRAHRAHKLLKAWLERNLESAADIPLAEKEEDR